MPVCLCTVNDGYPFIRLHFVLLLFSCFKYKIWFADNKNIRSDRFFLENSNNVLLIDLPKFFSKGFTWQELGWWK